MVELGTQDQRREFAHELALKLPICGDEDDPREDAGDYISLCDLVPTALEVPWNHFFVRKYEPEASGVGKDNAWAIIEALPSAEKGRRVLHLTVETMRLGVERYIYARLEGGMSEKDVRVMVDGTYTDAIVADAIVQFALYEEVIYS